MTNCELSIIIVNWNTRDILLDCLASIAQHPPLRSYEIWLVDNASSDGSVAAVQQHYPQVQVIANDHNAGFAAANNQAIEASQGAFVLLLNSDTIVLDGALEQLTHFMEANPTVGIAGSQLLNHDGSLQPSWAAFPTIWSELRGTNVRKRRSFPSSDGTEAYAVDWVGGACFMLRREAIRQAGLMDAGYFMYAEETDWCYRIKQLGWEVCYYPASRVIHLGGQSSRKASTRMKAELYRSKLRFFQKHYGAGRARLLHGLLQIGLVAKAGLGLIMRGFGGSRAAAGVSIQRDALALSRALSQRNSK